MKENTTKSDKTTAPRESMTLHEYSVKFKDSTAITVWSEVMEMRDEMIVFSILVEQKPVAIVILRHREVDSITFQRIRVVERQAPEIKWGYYEKMRYGRNKIIYFWSTGNIGEKRTGVNFYTRGEEYGFYSITGFMYRNTDVTKCYEDLNRWDKKRIKKMISGG